MNLVPRSRRDKLLLSAGIVIVLIAAAGAARDIKKWCCSLPAIGSRERPLRIGISPWLGFAPGLLSSGGLTTQENSRFGGKKTWVEWKPTSSSCDIREDVDVISCSTDLLALNCKKLLDYRAFLHTDRSERMYSMIVRENKCVPYNCELENLPPNVQVTLNQSTPAAFAFLAALKQDRRLAFFSPPNFPAKANQEISDFVDNKADAMIIAEHQVAQVDASSLLGTKKVILPTSIAHVLMAKQSFINSQEELLKRFVKIWFESITSARREANQIPGLYRTAFKKEFGSLPPEGVQALLNSVNWADEDDNAVFFGITGRSNSQDFQHRFDTGLRSWSDVKLLSRHNPYAAQMVDLRFVYSNWRTQTVTSASGTQTVESASGTQTVTSACKTDGSFLTFTVYFDTNKSAVGDSQATSIDEALDALRVHDSQVCITGFTDDSASEQYNEELGLKRAQAVGDFFTLRRDGGTATPVVRSLGKKDPLGDNGTPEGRRLNRRVTIQLQ
jgi:outer membrane protein OmpA-like peptidoglycan-associated protein